VKQRDDGVTAGALVGDVRDASVVIVDDLIATGTTLRRAAEACRANGAAAVRAAATHGVFTAGAGAILAAARLDELVVLDTVAQPRLQPGPQRDALVVLGVAPLLAEAIRRLHGGGSLSDLVDRDVAR
jgi:ribose-phosphate pyrophosphokinase